jgi:hypothetical protein
MPPRNHEDDGCISEREMDRVYKALAEIETALRDINARQTKQDDRMNGIGLKVATVIGGCIVLATLIPIAVIFFERVSIK